MTPCPLVVTDFSEKFFAFVFKVNAISSDCHRLSYCCRCEPSITSIVRIANTTLLFLSLHRAFCNSFNYTTNTHTHTHTYIYNLRSLKLKCFNVKFKLLK